MAGSNASTLRQKVATLGSAQPQPSPSSVRSSARIGFSSACISWQQVQEGGGVTTLAAQEWLDGWREFRRRHPDMAG
jgi:hypothetical protein